MLHAEIVLQRRADVSPPVVAPVSSVLPLLGDGSLLCVSSCSAFEVGDILGSANSDKTKVVHHNETVLLAWHKQNMRDLFFVFGKIAGGACVAPAIVEFVSSKLEKTAPTEEAADLLASARSSRRDHRVVRRLLDCGVLFLGLRHGCDLGMFAVLRNRETSGLFWTPVAPVSTSVLLSLSRSPRPRP